MEAALTAEPNTSGQSLAYIESIHHPAMTTPLTTRGTLSLLRGDILVRDQTEPKRETTEIGTRFITVRRENYENTVPIPSKLAPMLSLLRGIITGQRGALTDGYAGALETTDSGWVARLTPKGEDVGALSLYGCGEVLDGIGFDLDGGERREIRFSAAE